MIISLVGVKQTNQYNAWIFPGGEIHLKLNDSVIEELNVNKETILIDWYFKGSDDLLLLMLMVDTINKDFDVKIEVIIRYFPYQQADRDFGVGECFSLKTVTKILNTLEVKKFFVFDSHSDVAPALLNKCVRIDNKRFIEFVVNNIGRKNLKLLSPDAGSFKKVFKLSENLGFIPVVSASKYRDEQTRDIVTVIPPVKDCDLLLVDDICLGGKTFINIAEQLRKNGFNGKLYLAISHGIFSNGYDELEKHFEMIFTTNSRYSDKRGKVKVFNLH
jgi:ribose-phosphate pyrophosphokinase